MNDPSPFGRLATWRQWNSLRNEFLHGRRCVFARRLPFRPGLAKRAEITKRTKLNVMDRSFRRYGDEMNIPERLNGIVSRHGRFGNRLEQPVAQARSHVC